MKIKHIIIVILSFFISINADAQILKKLKKKAENAVERTVLRKTDQKVSKTTEQAFDSLVNRPKSGKDTSRSDNKKKKLAKQNNSDEVDLELDVSVAPYIVALNANTTFIINLKNTGAIDATDVSVNVVVPSGYIYTNSQISNGSYSSNDGVWTVGKIASGGAVQLSVMVLVIGESDLMFHAEVATCAQSDIDSKPNSGVDTDNDSEVIDDTDDEDDGDAQDVVIEKALDIDSNEEQSNSGSKPKSELEDIKLVLKDKKGRTQHYTFDADPLAMRVDFEKKKEPSMYFDYKGFVYVSDGKSSYIKVPFSQLKSMKNMNNEFSAFGGKMPNAPAANEPIDYYGMNLGPHKYPILEWAFIYKPHYFEDAADITEEVLNCRSASGCRKFTSNKGKDKGSYVLFDYKGRLAEIFTINTGNAVYTYEECTVVLPAAKAMNMPFRN